MQKLIVSYFSMYTVSVIEKYRKALDKKSLR